MNIRGTDFVLYHVGDHGRAVAFYRDVLGLRLEMESEAYHWAEFDAGNITLALLSGSRPAASDTSPRIALAVQDIEAAHAELELRKARGLEPLQDYGVCQAFTVRDPDGNVILLHHRADGTFGHEPVGAAEAKPAG